MRGPMALALAGWFAVVTPCVALAQCAASAPVRSCCCKSGAACCCRGSERGTPAPAPAIPAAKVAPDQAAELPAVGGGVATAALACQLAAALVVAAPVVPPAYLSACSFRC
ncbi:MAG: hypothetical protein EPN53_00230 [Acidobacteria bacterium]|nr:MAG: hypothetical protein EPN53_00230 [Acidobacteriota bacterium]